MTIHRGTAIAITVGTMNMRVLAGLILATSMIAADAPLMGNYVVWQMHRKGVPTEQIISAIRGSEPRFNLDPAEVAKLTSNGVPQSVIDAMWARQLAPPNQLVSSPRTPRAPRERPEHWGMLPGTPEATIGGGLVTVLRSPGKPEGTFNLEGAVAMSRYFAALASMNRYSAGGSVFGENFGESITDVMFGVRASVSNRSRVTPFVTGLVGFQRVNKDDLFFTRTSSSTGGGAGVGVDVNATRQVGFRFEARATRSIENDWLMRANFGVFFRFGQ